jgi:hypothetical protein
MTDSEAIHSTTAATRSALKPDDSRAQVAAIRGHADAMAHFIIDRRRRGAVAGLRRRAADRIARHRHAPRGAGLHGRPHLDTPTAAGLTAACAVAVTERRGVQTLGSRIAARFRGAGLSSDRPELRGGLVRPADFDA